MTAILAIVVGGLYAAAMYLMTRRSAVKLAVGLALLSHASNLLIFTAAGVSRARPPLIVAGAETEAIQKSQAAAPGTAPASQTGASPNSRDVARPYVDPLPQALVLTAIVISFGVLAFALVLVRTTFAAAESDDVDQMAESSDTKTQEPGVEQAHAARQMPGA